MNKISVNRIALILEREYLSRVRKKSFIIMSILGPILIAAVYVLPTVFLALKTETTTIAVLDDSGFFDSTNLKSTSQIKYRFIEDNLEAVKNKFKQESNAFALLYIPKFDTLDPKGFTIYSEKPLPATQSIEISRAIEDILYERRLAAISLDQKTLNSLKTKIALDSKNLTTDTENTNSLAAMGVGFAGGLAIYMFIFIYAQMVMRGVLEEKTNRIVEIIISSVRPVELMLGKILGVALVALTQILIWVVLVGVLLFVSGIFLGINTADVAQTSKDLQADSNFSKITGAILSLDFFALGFGFLFYFIFGYLMYSALFAAVGASVDNETDTQQFMLPITLPLLLAIILIGQIMQEPDGSIAFWLSIIPLTSPVVMMVRLPYIGLDWQVWLSMALLLLAFWGATWLAARIYRVGILLYGKKPTYKELFQWIFIK